MSENIRQKQFKNTGKHEEMRRRRAEGSLELRKQRKDEQLMKRRNVDLHDDSATEEEQPQQNVVPAGQGVPVAPGGPKSLLPLSLVESFNILKHGGDYEHRFKAVESIRRHLSRQKNPPIDEVIKMGMVPYLVGVLSDPAPKLQFEAAWTLTNITSGNAAQTMAAVNDGCIIPLIRLLSSSDIQVAEQSAWALGNITGESAIMRDVVINAGIVDPLLALAKRSDLPIECTRTVAWALSNLCRYKTPSMVAFSVVEKLIPVLAILIYHPDASVVCDTCWSLAYISDGDEERISLVLNAGVLERVMQLASGSDVTLIAPSLRCLGNIVTGDDQQTQAVINCGVLGTVVPVALNSNKSTLTRECCWLLSNICAGNPQQIQTVLNSGVVEKVVQLLDKGDFRTQTEATWVVYNICSGGTADQAVILLQHGALVGVCNMLKSKESRILLLALDTLSLLLGVAAKIGQLEAATMVVEECEGLDLVEQLQNHENEDVYQKALQLVEKYFSETEEVGASECDDGPAEFKNPTSGPPGGFNF